MDKLKTRSALYFLPDSGSVRSLLKLMMIAEICVLLHQLSLPAAAPMSWHGLIMSSLFIQWHVLTGSAFIYLSRRWLTGRSLFVITLSVLMAVAFISLTLTLLAQYLTNSHAPQWFSALKNTLIALIAAAIFLHYFYIRHQLNLQQLDSLQARIRPHFLYNSMNIIACLIRQNPDKAEQAVEDLSDLFRSSLRDKQLITAIGQETELCRRYLRIEQNRLGDRLQTQWQVSELPKGLTIPAFTIQPLIENAIYHGIQPLEQGGLVKINITINNNRVQVLVENPMPLTGTISRGNRIALENIRSRLTMLYGKEAQLNTEIRAGCDTRQFIARMAYPHRG